MLKGYLTASSPHLGIGNPNNDFSPHVTSLSVGPVTSPNGIAVLWGFASGEVALTTANKVMADGSQAQTRYLRSRVAEEHQKSVMCTKALSDGFWATGDSSGKIKIWEGTPKKLRMIWENTDVPDDCAIEFAGDIGPGKTGVLLAGFTSGSVLLYTGLLSDALSTTDEPFTSNAITIIPRGDQADGQTETLTKMTLLIGPYSSDNLIEFLYCDLNARKLFFRVMVNVEAEDPHISRIEYAFESFGVVSAITPSFTLTPGEKSFVIAGDTAGNVYLWEWSKQRETLQGVIHPINRWAVYDDEAISTIEIGENVIGTGRYDDIVLL